ncbi:MAG: cytochrome c3 family protein [Burkholderiales bacterium]
MHSYRALLAWFAAAFLLCTVTWIFAGFGGAPHLSGVACNNCHLSGKGVDPTQAGRLIASQEVLCGVCHKNVKRMSHPTGFTPTRALPAAYPLDWKKDMTCSTCHDVHGTEPGLIRGDKRGKDLCLVCHDPAFFDNMKDAGISLQQSGHALVDMKQMQKNTNIDALSLQCMGCHNNQVDAGVTVSQKGIVRHSSGAANHPIGSDYQIASMNRGFHAKGALPKEIWLPNGKLSCVSCHQAYTQQHGQLVLPNDHSSLCAQCHDL